MESHRKVPTLLELCTKTAIANIRYIGDVGETDLYLLKDILPHCTMEQLERIEDETIERDLTPVTNDLWKRFYEESFGAESMDTVIKRMKEKKRVFTWRKLYEAKKHEREQAKDKMGKRLKQLYEEERAKKQSRQTKLCEKLPPASKKRNFFGGTGLDGRFSSSKSNLLKKARIECLRSHEAQMHAVMRSNAAQRNSLSHQSGSRSTEGKIFPRDSGSSSKYEKLIARK